MKIAIMSDLHLGFKQYGADEREEDFYNQFLKVCFEISKKNPDVVIIGGDLFNKPNPSPKAIGIYEDGINKINALKIIAIKGNHTMLLRDNHYSIDEYFGTHDNNKKYSYLDDTSLTLDIEGDKISVDGITYRTSSSIQEFLKIQKEKAKYAPKEDDYYNILVIHQAIKEFCGFVGEELSIRDFDIDPYDLIICGHIHSRYDTKLSNKTYFIQPGSIERMNTTEALDEEKNGKGFYLVDTKDKSVEFCQVECDRKFFLGEVKIKSKEELEKHLEEMEKSISKLKTQPIISYNYSIDMENIEAAREIIGCINKDVLLNKSNIDDTSKEEIVLEITDTEMPTVLEAIKMYGKESGLEKNEIDLATDLYNSLTKGGDDSQSILKDYYEKTKKEYKKKNFNDLELEEFIKYFE